MSKLNVTVLYVGEQEFVVRENGGWMADAVRRAVADADAALAERLQFDPEADGVAIGAPDREALERTIRLAIGAGLFVGDVMERLHPDLDDVQTMEWEAEPAAQGHGDYSEPIVAYAATEKTVVGSLTVSSFHNDLAPTRDTAELAAIVRRAVADQDWSDDVSVRTEHDMFVLVEAPSADRLDQVGHLIGLPGLEPGAEETFAWMREKSPKVTTPRADPQWAVTPHKFGPTEWEARGVLSDVPGYEGREPTTETLRWLYDRLDAVEPDQAHVDLTAHGPEILIYGATAQDVQWAVDALHLTPGRAAEQPD